MSWTCQSVPVAQCVQRRLSEFEALSFASYSPTVGSYFSRNSHSTRELFISYASVFVFTGAIILSLF